MVGQPAPAAPAPGGAGDYSGWTWQQIQAAIMAGQAQTIHDAGTDFDDTKTKLEDLAKNAQNYRDQLTGPDGTWQGPASQAFSGLTTEMITDVQQHATALTPYKGALDDAGNALTDAQTAAGTAITQAGQDTITEYNGNVSTYNTAATAYNAGTGPAPVDPGPAPYVQDTNGGMTVDVTRYPDIEAALNEKMRQIIATLAGKYQTAGGRLAAPDDAPPPNPQDVPPPATKDNVPAPQLPPPAAVPPANAANVPAPQLAPPTLLDPAAGAPPPPPEQIAPLAPGVGNLAVVTQPGGLANLPLDPRAVPPPKLTTLDPAAGRVTPLAAGVQSLPGAQFNGVLGDRPAVTPDSGPARPGGVPTPLLSAAPAGSGVLGAPETAFANSGLFAAGPQHLTGTPPTGIGRGSAGSNALGAGGVPPMTGMAAGGYGGMMSAGPGSEDRMFLDDVFAENEGGLGKSREGSLVSGPEGNAPFAGSPYGGTGDGGQYREREYADTENDNMWGSTTGMFRPGR